MKAVLISVLLSVLLIAAVVLAVIKIVKDRRNGKCCSCGGQCSGCPMGAHCRDKDSLGKE